ncbi:MAG: hypothetical protein M3O02_03905 [Acidobacteriota bacterium]|nr:hypothetical protein [Acidobacteriota bacterium]
MYPSPDDAQQSASASDAATGTPTVQDDPSNAPQAPSSAPAPVDAPSDDLQSPQSGPQAPQTGQPHPLSAYSHISADGKYGWDGTKWIDVSPVSNASAPQHPLVAKAGILHQVASALAGGPRYRQTIDPQTGQSTYTKIPLSGRDIGMAIAMEALSGAAAGLGQRGPGATGMAAAAGFQQGQQLIQQRNAAQDQQAQQDYTNQVTALTRKAQAYEANSRAILNTSQSERYGVDSLKDSVSINAPLLASYQDASAVIESNISQDSLSAGLASGKYSPTAQIAVPDGFTNINGKYEQTFSVVQNPSAKVPLTTEQAKTFADAGIPGWTPFKTSKVPDGYEIPGTMLANANAQLQAMNLMKQDVSQVSDTLASSSDKTHQQLAKVIPDFNTLLNDKDNGPVLRSALMRFQKYVSHSDQHGMDLYQSLQQMAAPSKPDPNNPKQSIPNPDAGAAQTIAGAFGNGNPKHGWAILQGYHDAITPEPIKSVADAESIATDPASSPREVARAKAYLSVDQQQHARQPATGTGNGTLNVSSLSPQQYGAIIDGIGTNTLDASQMLRYGKADQLKILADVKSKYPHFDGTQYQANLGLAKWATSGKGGDIIQGLNTLHAHAQDFSDNVNALGNTDSSLLNTPINVLKRNTGNQAVVSTLGRLLAVRTEYMNVLNNNHALSVEDKADANTLMNENQSPQQWLAAINQITHTADLRGSETNARYRATFGKDMPNYRAPQSQSQSQSQAQGGAASVVPPGATPGRDASGRVIGYRTSDGKVVRF